MSYLEIRHARTNTLLAADIAMHLNGRQHLGRSLIICERPLILMSLVRKQWFKLARALQRERASTVSAEKILRLTGAITYMHGVHFSFKLPEVDPAGQVFFMSAAQAASSLLPLDTYTVYLACEDFVPQDNMRFLKQAPRDSLVVAYTASSKVFSADMQPKAMLEERFRQAQAKVDGFLRSLHVSIEDTSDHSHIGNPLDEALDLLLEDSHAFLMRVAELHHTYELAQPLIIQSAERRRYDTLMMLAHRVQMLTPASYSAAQSIYQFNEDETFFLHDSARAHSSIFMLLSSIPAKRRLRRALLT